MLRRQKEQEEKNAKKLAELEEMMERRRRAENYFLQGIKELPGYEVRPLLQ